MSFHAMEGFCKQQLDLVVATGLVQVWQFETAAPRIPREFKTSWSRSNIKTLHQYIIGIEMKIMYSKE